MALTKKRFLALSGQFFDEYHKLSRWDSRHVSHSTHAIGNTESYEMHSGAFYQHRDDDNSGVINKLNSFLIVLGKLVTWQTLMEKTPDRKEQYHIIFEEIMPLFQLAMDYPYAIKSSLIYSCVDVFCVGSRVFKQPVPKFDRYKLKTKTLDLFRPLIANRSWKGFDELCLNLDEIDADQFRTESSYFRIRTHHRIPPQVEIGEKLLLTYWESTTAAGYTVGSESALPLKKIVPLLAREHEKCLRAYRKFWAIAKQINRDVKDLNNDLAKRFRNQKKTRGDSEVI